MTITPLHDWIARKTGLSAEKFNFENLRAYQLDRLHQVVAYARQRSPFYRALFHESPSGDFNFTAFTGFPFTSARDLREDPARFVCVPQDEVSRIVTLPTSGTTGSPKRVFFSASDQQLTIDFFAVGMSTLARAGDRVLILLPGARPGSVGDLLFTGLQRLGCLPFKSDQLDGEENILELMKAREINLLVGSPVQLQRLAVCDASAPCLPAGQVRAVLTSTDRLPRSIIASLQKQWGCEVFDHYGMTETGLGGGVECSAHAGYHLREADLYFEVINPLTGMPVADGETGEVVVTTLTRTAMPLIRYRTGDISRFLSEKCPCGSFLRRLERIHHRLDEGVGVGGGLLRQADLDEVVFAVEGVMDFTAALERRDGVDTLEISTVNTGDNLAEIEPLIRRSLLRLPAIRDALSQTLLAITLQPMARRPLTGAAAMQKRSIRDLRI